MQISKPNGSKFEIIDAFNHFLPKECIDALDSTAHGLAKQERERALVDLDYRIKRLGDVGIDRQILSMGGSPFDAPVESHAKIARATNDGFAKIVEKNRDKFHAVGTVTLSDVGFATDELKRCVNDLGLLGVQILSNADGKPIDLPEFEPFYSKAESLGAGLWIHPAHVKNFHYWTNEYLLDYALGWGFDESLALFRLARGGVLERHPRLKIIAHHMGVMIPFYAHRIHKTIMREGKNGKPPEPLTRPPMDYLKMLYADTAEGSWKPALVCAQLFYGVSHILFATDFPFGGVPDPNWPLQIINTIMGLDIADEEKGMILGRNVANLFNI